MAGESSQVNDARVKCRFCNKKVVNNVVKCTVCECSLHGHCCERRNLVINLTDNTTNCCESIMVNESQNLKMGPCEGITNTRELLDVQFSSQQTSSARSSCGKCGRKLDRKYDDLILCGKCSQLVHLECANMTVETYHSICRDGTVGKWNCNACMLGDERKLPDNDKNNPGAVTITDVAGGEIDSSCMEKLEAMLHGHCMTVSNLALDLVKRVVGRLEDENRELKSMLKQQNDVIAAVGHEVSELKGMLSQQQKILLSLTAKDHTIMQLTESDGAEGLRSVHSGGKTEKSKKTVRKTTVVKSTEPAVTVTSNKQPSTELSTLQAQMAPQDAITDNISQPNQLIIVMLV